MLDGLFRALGYGLCHQLTERSFVIGGYQLPVCARDTGIYLGFVFGIAALWLLNRGKRPTEIPRWPVLVLMGAFVAAMAWDGITSYAGLRDTTNDLRLVTGYLTGWALAGLTVPMVNSQLWVHPGFGRILDGWRQVGGWLLMLVASFAIVRWVFPALDVVYPLLNSAAIIGTLVCVNLVFVGLMPSFERKVTRLRDAWAQLLIALVLSILEIAGAAWLRLFVEGLA